MMASTFQTDILKVLRVFGPLTPSQLWEGDCTKDEETGLIIDRPKIIGPLDSIRLDCTKLRRAGLVTDTTGMTENEYTYRITDKGLALVEKHYAAIRKEAEARARNR